MVCFIGCIFFGLQKYDNSANWQNKIGRIGKSAYLCIRFHKEIIEALCLGLFVET